MTIGLRTLKKHLCTAAHIDRRRYVSIIETARIKLDFSTDKNKSRRDDGPRTFGPE